MFTTISIQKKFIYFFLASLVISAILTLSISKLNIGNEKKSGKTCEKEIELKFNYNTILNTTSKGVTNIHSYLKSLIKSQLTSNFPTLVSNNEVYLDGDHIKFSGNNCDENFDRIFAEFKNIKNLTFEEFKGLKNYLDANQIAISLSDELIFMATTRENIIEETVYIRSKKTIHPFIISTIQFFIFLMCLNLGYFFISKVRVKIY